MSNDNDNDNIETKEEEKEEKEENISENMTYGIFEAPKNHPDNKSGNLKIIME